MHKADQDKPIVTIKKKHSKVVADEKEIDELQKLISELDEQISSLKIKVYDYAALTGWEINNLSKIYKEQHEKLKAFQDKNKLIK